MQVSPLSYFKFDCALSQQNIEKLLHHLHNNGFFNFVIKFDTEKSQSLENLSETAQVVSEHFSKKYSCSLEASHKNYQLPIHFSFFNSNGKMAISFSSFDKYSW